MDVCYIVRPGDDNEELRHSLRSVAANLPHRRVVIAGHVPKWVKNVVALPRQQDPHRKYENAELNWRAIVDSDKVSDSFIIMNDDFFIMQKLNALPDLHRGPLAAVQEYYSKYEGHYANSLNETAELLQRLGIDDLKSYALHIPMVMTKARRRAAQAIIAEFGYMPAHIQMRTFYGNLWRVSGEQHHDVKVLKKQRKPDGTDIFLSTNDQTFNDGLAGQYIRQVFSDKCKYER